MREIGGIVVIVASAGIALVTAIRLRPKLPRAVTDPLVAFAGAGLGVGALLVQQDVRLAEWILAPAVLGVAAVVHARALFAGS